MTQVNNSQLDLKTNENADFIFKYNNYKNVFIVIETNGTPEGVMLNLLNENDNQLYSPVDTNGNEITTRCYITSGQKNLIQLPAQFNADLSEYTPFSPGTYNWKLQYNGGNGYTAQTIPLTVEIRDFKTWEIQNTEIFPNQNIELKLRTYIDTILPEIDSNLLTANATYDTATGVVTYPPSDINIQVGEHTEVINQEKNYKLNYTVKQPFGIRSSDGNVFDYSPIKAYYVEIFPVSNCTMKFQPNLSRIILNNKEYQGKDTLITQAVGQTILCKASLPPGSYQVVGHIIGTDNIEYTDEFTMTITTNNCTISLTSNDNDEIISTYLYNDTSITNAQLTLVDSLTNTHIDTSVTDTNGEINWGELSHGQYKVIAINNNNEVILESNIYNAQQYLSDITIDNGNLIIDKYDENENIITNLSISNDGNLIITTETEVTQGDSVISDIDIDNDGNLIYDEYIV